MRYRVRRLRPITFPSSENLPDPPPVAKGSPLAQSLVQALEHLIQTGAYRQIATNWGVEEGVIDKPVINGAVS